MRTNSRSRGQGLVLAVLTVVVSLPELAQAQQGGLFPLAPITQAAGPVRPGRPDLQDLQESVFRLSSHVLATIPGRLGLSEPRGAGQGEVVQGICRSRPTKIKARRRNPTPRKECDAQPGPTRPGLPALPRGRSPFEIDRPDAPPGTLRAQARRNPIVPQPTDPFELDKPDPATRQAPARPGAGQNRPAAPGASNGPELSAPSERTGQSSLKSRLVGRRAGDARTTTARCSHSPT